MLARIGAAIRPLGAPALAATAGRRALQRGFRSSAISLKRLRQLEEEANKHPTDTTRQLALMNACNQQGQATIAVRRFESGHFASDESVAKEYIRALTLTNQLSRLSLAQLTTQLGAGASEMPGLADAHRAATAAQFEVSRGTSEMPLHVQWTEAPRAQLWKLARLLALGGMAAAAIMMLLDEKSMPKGLGFSSEVSPVVGTTKRFSDVVGVDEAKNELLDIVKYLRQPKTFTFSIDEGVPQPSWRRTFFAPAMMW